MMHRLKEEVEDYAFRAWNNKDVMLSSLFGRNEDLILIHNMGRGCPYCTMWADGFNGVIDHLEDRASFVVVSPDSPKIQKAFARRRHWKFKMLSSQRTAFNKDMGFEKDGWAMPGVSAFHKDKRGKIFRVSKDKFGPHDEYCIVYHFFDLLPKGTGGWQPRFNY